MKAVLFIIDYSLLSFHGSSNMNNLTVPAFFRNEFAINYLKSDSIFFDR